MRRMPMPQVSTCFINIVKKYNTTIFFDKVTMTLEVEKEKGMNRAWLLGVIGIWLGAFLVPAVTCPWTVCMAACSLSSREAVVIWTIDTSVRPLKHLGGLAGMFFGKPVLRATTEVSFLSPSSNSHPRPRWGVARGRLRGAGSAERKRSATKPALGAFGWRCLRKCTSGLITIQYFHITS